MNEQLMNISPQNIKNLNEMKNNNLNLRMLYSKVFNNFNLEVLKLTNMMM